MESEAQTRDKAGRTGCQQRRVFASPAAGGKGFRGTWFYGLPLLSLDHIWLGRDWHVLEARKIWKAESDHAAVFVRAR